MDFPPFNYARRKPLEMSMTYEQIIRFNESNTLSIVRESAFFGMNMLWFVSGDCADWLGFQDDYGTFVPVDWC